MRRWFFRIFTALSLSLCLATVALWIRSYQFADTLSWDLGEASTSKRQSPDSKKLHGTWNSQIGLRSQCGKLEFGQLDYGLPTFDYWKVDNWFGSDCISGNHYHSQPAVKTEPLTEYWDPGPGGLFDDAGGHFVKLPPEPIWRRLGFTRDTIVAPPMIDMDITFGSASGEIYAIPDWPVVTLAAIAPLLYFIKSIRARRRTNRNLCAKCSYDLRSHNPSDKCPECGTTIPANPKRTP